MPKPSHPKPETRNPKPAPPDRHALYELCAQSPERDARILRSIAAATHAAPRVLGEDFCATAALSRAWCELSPGHRAVGVDHDADVLARAAPHPRVRLVRADVLAARQKADLVFVGNFSICELHARERLVAYLRHARSRLTRGGSFICDIYGGSDAFATGVIDQTVKPPLALRGAKIVYSWEQRTADPLTGRVVNAMHFAVHRKGAKPERFQDAFVYDWRLWSVPELRDAMREAGYRATEVYPRLADARDQDGNLYVSPVEDPIELGDSFSVYVVGRMGS